MKHVFFGWQVTWQTLFSVILAIHGGNVDAEEPARLFIKVDSTLPEKVQAYLADVGIPTTVEVQAGKSIAEAIKELCGISSQIYLDKAIELNTGLVLDAVDEPRRVDLPACVRTSEEIRETVVKGDALEKIVKRKFENDRSRDWEDRLRKINRIINDNKDLKADSSIVLPQSLPPTSLPIRPDTLETTQKIIDEVKRLISEEPTQPIRNIENGNSDIALIKPVNIDDPIVSNPACKNARSKAGPGYPFNAELVARILSRSFDAVRKKLGKMPQAATVAIIDTGLDGFDSTFPKAWFHIKQWGTDQSDRGVDCHSNWYGANANAKTNPNHTGFCYFDDYENKWHGTFVTDLVEGGEDFRGLSKQKPDDLMLLQEFRVVKTVLKKEGSESKYLFNIDDQAFIDAVEFVSKRRPNIVNVSLRSGNPLEYFKKIFIDHPEILVVVAAGNDGYSLGKQPVYPANYGGREGDLRSNLITVAAYDGEKKLAKFSNKGYKRADLAAPGCDLRVLTPTEGPTYVYGTSFAAPLVTFTAAILSTLGIDHPQEIKNRLMAATDFDDYWKNYVWSSGRLNIPKTIAVYDDVLQKKNDSADEPILLIGNWMPGSGNSLKLCNNKILMRNQILKVTPVENDGTLKLHIVLRDEDGKLDFDEECEPEDITTEFVKASDFTPAEGNQTESQTIPWTDVVDIVPKSLSR